MFETWTKTNQNPQRNKVSRESFHEKIPGGGALVSEVGYHLLRKKNHVIRVVFQDKAMYARTSFRGAKTCKIGKKGMFLVILTNF